MKKFNEEIVINENETERIDLINEVIRMLPQSLLSSKVAVITEEDEDTLEDDDWYTKSLCECILRLDVINLKYLKDYFGYVLDEDFLNEYKIEHKASYDLWKSIISKDYNGKGKAFLSNITIDLQKKEIAITMMDMNKRTQEYLYIRPCREIHY